MVRKYTYLEVYLEDINRMVSLSDFEKHFGLPHQTVKSHLSEFVKAKVLLEEKRARFRFYTFNRKNPLSWEYLLVCEKERLFVFLEKNVLFSRLYQVIKPVLFDAKVLLFGSAVSSKTFQDVDLLIIGDNKPLLKELRKFQETYSIKFHIVRAAKESLSDTFILELRKKHIMLNSHDYFMELIYSGD